jgi:hypothetical protein
LNEPDFSTLSTAFSMSIKLTGSLDMIGAGKFLYDTSCTSVDVEMDKLSTADKNKVLMSICLDLYDKFLIPFETEVKKK